MLKSCTNYLLPISYTCQSVRASDSFFLLDFPVVLSTSYMPVISRGPIFLALYSMGSYLSFILRANQALLLHSGCAILWYMIDAQLFLQPQLIPHRNTFDAQLVLRRSAHLIEQNTAGLRFTDAKHSSCVYRVL